MTSGWSGPGVELPFICDLAPAPAPVTCPIGQSYQCQCQDTEHETVEIHPGFMTRGDSTPLLMIPSDDYATFYGLMIVVFLGILSYPINCILYYCYKFRAKQARYGPVKTVYSSEDGLEN